MEYIIGIGVSVFILYKVVVALGRKNAKDVLVANFDLDRKKLDLLSDPQLTALHFSLESHRRKGELMALLKLVEKYR